MTKSKTHKKKGAAAIITAAVLVLIALFGMAACSNAAQPGTGTDGSTALPEAPFVEDGASLILSLDKLDIKVTVRTSDGTPVMVEGCEETRLTSGTETVLHAKGRLVILKGNIKKLDFSGLSSSDYSNKLIALNVQGLAALQELICYKTHLVKLNVQGLADLRWLDCFGNQLTELNVQGCAALQELSCGLNHLTDLNVQGLTVLQKLYCWGNQLTELNVHGCSALQELNCHENRLNADAFKKIFDDLPQQQNSDNAACILYTERTGVTEGNHKDFTAPPDLAAAFNNAKTVKKWKMCKIDADWHKVEL